MNDDTDEYYERRIMRYMALRDIYQREKKEPGLIGVLVSEPEYKALLMALKTWIIKFRYRFENGEKIYYDFFGNR
tara:strand:- start:837 stop:1061 length:225 start_codon:yes stop_codon:yes gene_type:complete